MRKGLSGAALMAVTCGHTATQSFARCRFVLLWRVPDSLAHVAHADVSDLSKWNKRDELAAGLTALRAEEAVLGIWIRAATR